jgi:hypothetical protein
VLSRSGDRRCFVNPFIAVARNYGHWSLNFQVLEPGRSVRVLQHQICTHALVPDVAGAPWEFIAAAEPTLGACSARSVAEPSATQCAIAPEGIAQSVTDSCVSARPFDSVPSAMLTGFSTQPHRDNNSASQQRYRDSLR